MPLKNVTADYPPTMLIHGTADYDVPYEQAELMLDQLREHGVDSELFPIPGGGHYIRSDPQLVEASHTAAVAFINRYMKE